MKLLILLSCLAVGFFGTGATAATNTITPGKLSSGTITGSSFDVYQFTAEAGDRVSVFMAWSNSVSGTFEPTVAILTAGGVVVVEQTADSRVWLPSFQLTNSGTYYLLCRDRDGRTSLSGSTYNLTMVKLPGSNLVDAGEAGTISPGQNRSGSITGTDLDVYQFTAEAGDRVSVFMAWSNSVSGTFEPTVAILTAGGVVVVEQTADSRVWLPSFQLTNSGTYYLLCRDRDGRTSLSGSTYNLTMVKLPGSNLVDAGEAGTISPGQNRSGSITGTDLDVYQFTAEAGDRVSVFMAWSNSVSGTFEPTVAILTAGGVVVVEQTADSRVWLPSFQLTNSGTYYLLCRDRDGRTSLSGSTYNLTMVKLPGSNLVDAGEAGTISPGQNRSGSITGTDLDVYQFTAEAGDRVSVFMAWSNSVSGTFEPTVAILTAGGVVVVEQTADSRVWLPSFQLTNSGTYYLLCRDRDGRTSLSGSTYNLTMVKLPGSNLVDAGEAGTISPGQNRSGSITGTDLDVYQFTAEAGDRVAITVQETPSDSNFEPAITVYGQEGPLCENSKPTGTSQQLTACMTTSGDFFIVVRDTNGMGGGSYSLRMSFIAVPPPTNAPAEFLQVTECCGNVIVRWSTNATDFRLQTTETLQLPSASILWSNVPPPYNVSGRYFILTNSIPPPERYFRLVAP